MKVFTVGPVAMYPHTLEVAARPLPYFRTPEFSAMMLDSEQMLRRLLDAPADSYMVFLTASGTAAMEATVLNCFTEKDRVLLIDGGTFGHRFAEICGLHGIPFDAVRLPFGTPLTEADLMPFEGRDYTALLVNIHETSTGQLYDAGMLSAFCRRNGLYFIVDAISSFLADTYSVQQIGADATILSTQKGLALSPGMSFVHLSSRLYTERVARNPRRTMYLDFQEHVENMKRGQTPFTPAVGVALELHDMLLHLKKEGLSNRLMHVRRLAEDFRGRIAGMGLCLPSTPLSNAITPVVFPDGNAQPVYERLKLDYDTVVTPCGGALKDRVLRVAHIGNHSPEDHRELADHIQTILDRR